MFGPRATPTTSYERWRRVIRTAAQLSATYVISGNRPSPEGGAPIGGPSVVAGPDGGILAESTEPVSWVVLESSAVELARRDYPGYLDVRADLYARAWRGVSDQLVAKHWSREIEEFEYRP